MLQFISKFVSRAYEEIVEFNEKVIKKRHEVLPDGPPNGYIFIKKLDENIFRITGFDSISRLHSDEFKKYANYYGVAKGEGVFKMIKEAEFTGDKSIYRTLAEGDNLYFPIGNIEYRNNTEALKKMYYMK